MADRITGTQRIDLAEKISNPTWRNIAVAYLDLDYGVLSSLQAKHRENVQAQNEEIIDKWANRNPVDQVKKLARILHQAAEKYGDVDPYVVEEILKVTKEGSLITNTGPDSATSSARKKLTDPMKNNLAHCIYSPTDLRELAINGMGLSGDYVSAMLQNYSSNITEAATQVISEWSQSNRDPVKAYEDLCVILERIRRPAWINALQ